MENFRSFFKNNIDFLFVLDMQGNIIEINQAVIDILGYSEFELIGKSILTVHPPELREEAQKIFEKIVKSEIANCSLPLKDKKNNHIPVETRIFPGKWDSQDVLIGVSRNLTEIKLSEEKFYQVFSHSPVIKAISDTATGIFVHVNKQFVKTLGYTEDDVIGTSSKDLDLFYDFNQRRQALLKFSNDGYLEDFEVVVKTKNGELLNCLFSLHNIEIQTHKYILTTATNVTRLKQAETQIEYLFRQQKLLAEISQLFNSTLNLDIILNDVLRLLGEHTNAGMVYIFEDQKGGETTVNNFNWSNTGVIVHKGKPEEISYNQVPSLKKLLINNGGIFSDNIDELPQDLSSLLKQQRVSSIVVLPLYIQNDFYGFIGYHEFNSLRIWTAGEIDLLRTIANIISNALERRDVMKKLENSELRLKLAMESADEGLWDWNNETGYVYYSDVWFRMLGYVPGEVEPNVTSWEKLLHPDDKPIVNKALEDHLSGKTEDYLTEHRLKAKDGSWKWILDHGKVVERNENNQPVRTIGTHIEITRQKEIEKQLKESIDTKNKLFSIIAHDLRGPIGNFLPVLEVLTGDFKIDEKAKNKFLNDLKTASKLTFSLLENLLNWSRLQTNVISLNPVPFLIAKVIRDDIELLSSNATQKSITIVEQVDNNLSVFADPDSVQLVIRNLLSNAIKFTRVNGKVIISAYEDAGNITVEVEDNGIGISQENIDKLFNSQLAFATRGTNNETGSGLGLVLCKEFIERNGGKISIESNPGTGSKFKITLPKQGNPVTD